MWSADRPRGGVRGAWSTGRAVDRGAGGGPRVHGGPRPRPRGRARRRRGPRRRLAGVGWCFCYGARLVKRRARGDRVRRCGLDARLEAVTVGPDDAARDGAMDGGRELVGVRPEGATGGQKAKARVRESSSPPCEPQGGVLVDGDVEEAENDVGGTSAPRLWRRQGAARA